MDWQLVISTLLVIGCALYAARSLLPHRLRFGRKSSAAATSVGGACGGCSGCSTAAKPSPATLAASPAAVPPGVTESVIRIVPRQQARPGSAS